MSYALSTYPGFATPMPSPTCNWLNVWYRPSVVRITLGSGAVVPVPMLFWSAQALVLHGVADPDAVDGHLLEAQGLRPVLVNPDNLYQRKPEGGKAWVQIWAPDYQGTTVGPIQAIFASVVVERRLGCPADHQSVGHTWWWWYYGSNVVNQEFKQDVWGIPNQLGSLEIGYHPDSKGARLVEDGRIALRLRCDVKGLTRGLLVNGEKETPGPGYQEKLRRYCEKLESRQGKPSRFVAVARRWDDHSENDVEFVGTKLVGDRDDTTISFSPRTGDFYVGRHTAVWSHLDTVGFQPVSWDVYTDYSGVVKIYDDRGAPSPPRRRSVEDGDLDDRARDR